MLSHDMKLQTHVFETAGKMQLKLAFGVSVSFAAPHKSWGPNFRPIKTCSRKTCKLDDMPVWTRTTPQPASSSGPSVPLRRRPATIVLHRQQPVGYGREEQIQLSCSASRKHVIDDGMRHYPPQPNPS